MSGPAAGVVAERAREVWARLDDVTDPELDESVTELDFVTGVEIDQDGGVSIGFRLPTYWCAANFSFLMADDMRRAVLELPWVTRVTVELGEHMYAETINAGLARGLSFQETFGAEADGDLDELRRTFLLKAFQRRQAALLGHLIGAGHSAEALAGLTLAGLATLDLDPEGRKLLARYEERRAVAGPSFPAAPAFVDTAGQRLEPAALPAYVKGLRRVGVNAEFNGALCRGLLAARFDMETPFVPRQAREAAARP
jgi:metal-sulfur cluster biosynthetic enzyme